MEKNSNKYYFNFKLYLDGLKQLKLVGILGAIIIGLCAFCIPLGHHLTNANHVKWMQMQNAGNALYDSGYYSYSTGYRYGMLDLNPAIIAIFVVTPIFVLLLFNYMNSRSASDFFHSLPDRRISLLTSYSASILTLDAILAIESYVIVLVTVGALKYVSLDFTGFLKPFLTAMSGSVFVLGVMIIAMSLTGTIFSNLCVAAMLVAFPRIIVTVYAFIIAENAPLADLIYGETVLNDRLNVVTNLVTGWLLRGDYQAWDSYRSIIYTFAIGVIYLVIGAVLFNGRNSETATKAASNSKLQLLFRLVPAMCVSLLPIWFIFENMVNGGNIDSIGIFRNTVCYIFAVIAYFTYELVTTKKLKNILKSAKGLVWLLIFNVVFIAALKIGYGAITKPINNPEKIDYVKISFSENVFYHYGSDDYYKNLIENVKFDDETMITMLVDAYNEDLAALKNHQSMYRMPYSNNDVIDCLSVTFGQGMSSKTRKVYLTKEQEKAFIDCFENTPGIKEKFASFNENGQIDRIFINGVDISNKYASEVLEVFEAEMKQKDFAEILKRTIRYDNSSDRIGIQYTDSTYISITLQGDFPETKKVAYECINKQSDKDPMKQFEEDYEKYYKIKNIAPGSRIYATGSLSITLFEEGFSSYVSKSYYDYNSNNYFTATFDYYNDDTYGTGYIEDDPDIKVESDDYVVSPIGTDTVEISDEETDKYSYLKADFTVKGYNILKEFSRGLSSKNEVDVTKPFVKIEYNSSYEDSKVSAVMDSNTLCKYYNVDEDMIELIRMYK